MRFDPTIPQLPLTTDQRFFVSCWHNLVHQHSLDSHRVRTMNPTNALIELLRIQEASHPNEHDRTFVREETLGILQEDVVLQSAPFLEPAATLRELLKSAKKVKQPENSAAGANLIAYMARELCDEAQRTYVSSALTLLEGILLADPPAGTQDDRRRKITALTGGLLSTLVANGASMESLFQLYRQVLVPLKQRRTQLAGNNERTYVFARKFGLLQAIIVQPPKAYRLLFAIDNLSNAQDFPQEMGGIKFLAQVDSWPAARAQPGARRLFAEVTVESKDPRSAGTDAYTRISSVLDLVRFEYERERVHLEEEFLIQGVTQPGQRPERIRTFSIPKLVPNPFARVAQKELTLFVASVNGLLSTAKFSPEDRDRVLCAFRLYRQGADTNSFESKLISWWTAIEFLVRGIKGGKAIGTSVENSVTPVLCLAHAEKVLLDIKHTLLNCGHALIDPVTANPIVLNELSLVDLYRTLTRADIRPLVHDVLADDPYVQHRIDDFLSVLADPKKYDNGLAAHEQRVRWQLQRLWRARCDILHSARSMTSGVLFCANLEFYLKITLMNLLGELRRVKTLSSPEEFFERSALRYARLREDLNNSSVAALIGTLSNSIA